jgi:hypothetical protein
VSRKKGETVAGLINERYSQAQRITELIGAQEYK